MSTLSALRNHDLITLRSGAAYLKLYSELKQTAEREDNGPQDLLTRGGEVSIVERDGAEAFSLSYQRPDVIAKESVMLYRETQSEGGYQSDLLEMGQRGPLLQVTHRQDLTRDVFGDERKTVLYVDPSTGEIR